MRRQSETLQAIINSSRVDLRVNPKSRTPETPAFDRVYWKTYPDMHGNYLLLIQRLIYDNVLQELSDVDFKTLLTLHAEHEKLISDAFRQFSLTEVTKKALIANIKAFKEFFNNKLIPKDTAIAICFLGDLLADRGPNDYLTLLILKLLEAAGVIYKIILSNHDAAFIEEHLPRKSPLNEEKSRKVALTQTYAKSLFVLDFLIAHGIIQLDPTDIEKSYSAHLKLLSYARQGDQLTLYTHAPIDIETIKDAAHLFGIHYKDETAAEFCTMIDELNAAFLKRLNDGELNADLEKSKQVAFDRGNFDCDKHYADNPLETFIWSRICTIEERTERGAERNNLFMPTQSWADEESFRFIHGHTGPNRGPRHTGPNRGPRHTGPNRGPSVPWHNLDNSPLGKHPSIFADMLTTEFSCEKRSGNLLTPKELIALAKSAHTPLSSLNEIIVMSQDISVLSAVALSPAITGELLDSLLTKPIVAEDEGNYHAILVAAASNRNAPEAILKTLLTLERSKTSASLLIAIVTNPRLTLDLFLLSQQRTWESKSQEKEVLKASLDSQQNRSDVSAAAAVALTRCHLDSTERATITKQVFSFAVKLSKEKKDAEKIPEIFSAMYSGTLASCCPQQQKPYYQLLNEFHKVDLNYLLSENPAALTVCMRDCYERNGGSKKIADDIFGEKNEKSLTDIETALYERAIHQAKGIAAFFKPNPMSAAVKTSAMFASARVSENEQALCTRLLIFYKNNEGSQSAADSIFLTNSSRQFLPLDGIIKNLLGRSNDGTKAGASFETLKEAFSLSDRLQIKIREISALRGQPNIALRLVCGNHPERMSQLCNSRRF